MKFVLKAEYTFKLCMHENMKVVRMCAQFYTEKHESQDEKPIFLISFPRKVRTLGASQFDVFLS